MARKRGFKHEWHLYSITVIGLVGLFFFITVFKNPVWAAAALVALTILTAPFLASENWKNLPPETHKSVSICFIIAGLVWASYLVYTNKLLPILDKIRDKKDN